nr:hypothetical protein [uncultured Mediterraneibacter sp.]
MILFEKIKNKISGLIENESRKIYEATFSYDATDPLKYKEFIDIIQAIPLRDDIIISLSTENDDLFNFARTTQEDAYKNFMQDVLDDEIISVKLEVKKNIQQNHFSIYCFEKFVEDMVRLPIQEALKSFALFFKESNGYIIFYLFDNQNFFCTKTMFFISSDRPQINIEVDRNHRLQECRETSYFYNQDTYELLPDDFKIVVGYEGNPLIELFQKLEMILSLCMLASNSSIQQEKLKLQIMGQRSVEYTYGLNEIQGNPILYKIYDWIYSGGNNIDKALITRNIICLHCKYEPLLLLDAKVLAAIQSNYNLYLKENVMQYLELKNKVAEFITGIVSKTGEYATELLDKFKTNLIAIFGFLFTIIIANIVSDQPLDNIFTKDITIILEFVLAGSFVYLFISYKQSKYQMKKVYDSYDELKNSYNQILTDDDIKECFKNDQVIMDMKKTVKRSQTIYLVIWSCFLIILLFVLELITDNPIIIPCLQRILKI